MKNEAYIDHPCVELSEDLSCDNTMSAIGGSDRVRLLLICAIIYDRGQTDFIKSCRIEKLDKEINEFLSWYYGGCWRNFFRGKSPLWKIITKNYPWQKDQILC